MYIAHFWLAASLLLASFQSQAEVSGDWEYSVLNGEALISNYTGPGGLVEIPQILGGFPVKEVGILALSEKAITALSIPASVVRLGNNAFSGNPGLTSTSISPNITNLPTGVFANCGFSWFRIPDGVVSIGAGAFYECTNLSEITIPSSVIEIEPYAFLDCSSVTNVVFQGSPKLSDSSFAGTPYMNLNPILDGLGYVSLDGQTNGPLAAVFNFQGTDPTNVVIPSSVFGRPVVAFKTQTNSWLNTNFPVGYWYWVTNISRPLRDTSTFLTLPGSVTNIESESLSSAGLTGIEVAEGNPAFRAADGVLYGKDRPRLLRYPAGKTNLSHYSIQAGTESIESKAFSSAKLSSIEIPISVTRVGESAFGSSRLTNVTIPNSVTNLGSFAFHQCASLKNVVLGSGITTVDSYAFSYCTNLTNVSLSQNLRKIKEAAFHYCSKLEHIELPDSMLNTWEDGSIGGSAFHMTPVKTLTVPYGLLLSTSAKAWLTTTFPQVLYSGTPAQLQQSYAGSIARAVAGELATNQVFISNLAQAILAASNNYGLATKTEVGGAVTLGVQQVLSAPSDYNLFTPLQVQSERTAGQNDVLSTPNTFNLYTTNQIHNLGLGGIVLNRNTNNQLVLNYQVLQSSDLQNWSSYQQTELVISNAPANKMFLRVQAVEP